MPEKKRKISPFLLIMIVVVGLTSASALTAGCAGTCEEVRVDCRADCTAKYRSNLGDREYCLDRCDWEYRNCRDD